MPANTQFRIAFPHLLSTNVKIHQTTLIILCYFGRVWKFVIRTEEQKLRVLKGIFSFPVPLSFPVTKSEC
jgi:hypothetical protein